MNWQTKKLKYCGSLILGIVVIIAIFNFPQYSNQINQIVLVATLVILIWYAYDTHRIANQTVEANLRPVVLRSGFILSWESVKFSVQNGILEGKPLEFSILKNIAKDIRGWIVVSRKKYQLLFANNISAKDAIDGLSDLEKKVLIYLYEAYKENKQNSPQSITEVYQQLGIGEGVYVGILNSSRYVNISGNNFLLSDEGIRLMDADKPMEYRFEQNWGWMNAGTLINAIFDDSKYEETSEENSIYLTYKDIAENEYFTKENNNFSQSSGKL